MTDKHPRLDPKDAHRTGDPNDLGRFMLDRMTPKEVDKLLEKMDTHASFGKGEKSRA